MNILKFVIKVFSQLIQWVLFPFFLNPKISISYFSYFNNRKDLNFDESRDFVMFNAYPDSMFYKLTNAITKEIGWTTNQTIEAFGTQFYDYTKSLGYDKMIESLGGDIMSFLQNLDSLHEYFSVSQVKMIAPSFRVELCEQGLHLYYNSQRKGLWPWIVGMLGKIAIEIFHVRIEIFLLEEKTDHPLGARFTNSAKLLIKELNSDDLGSRSAFGGLYREPTEVSLSKYSMSYGGDSFISNRDMVLHMPYHFFFDNNLKIYQVGCGLQRINSNLRGLTYKIPLETVFQLISPSMPLNLETINRFSHASFVFKIKIDSLEEAEHKDILIRGEIQRIKKEVFLFFGSLRIMTLEELSERGMFLSDIPIYDLTRDLMFMNQQRMTEVGVSKKLYETTRDLQRATSALAEEKQKVNMLLTEMLPPKVAHQLLNGNRVEAEKFKSCTILFSDIVTFTNIASQCTPMQVVNMLNSLYSLFDKACERTRAYKVETIGDAYMVVAGVPEPDDLHAEIIAEQAMMMITLAGQVFSPATGKPLEIRVGMHSGPVVTGVVGERMPRYCLFGDTVNVASRMESHSIPGHIHCTSTTYQLLKSTKFTFVSRGQTEIKGKGKMETYFLVSDGKTQLKVNTSSDTNENSNGRGKFTEEVNVTCSERLGIKNASDFVNNQNLSSLCTIS